MHEHDQGLVHDLERMGIHRRRVLGWMASVPLVGAATTAAAAELCEVIEPEIAGPYPADGTNGPNALTLADIVRSDIRTSIGMRTGTATGLSIRMRLRVIDVADGCTPIEGYAVYLWHANSSGFYSMYTGALNQNYLRGVQLTNRAGMVTFTTVFPGCYPERWPHMHFEIYEDLASATDGTNAIATSQLALPEDTCDAVYARAAYATSATNFSGKLFEDDHVFHNDGGVGQFPTVTGTVASGLVLTLDVGV